MNVKVAVVIVILGVGRMRLSIISHFKHVEKHGMLVRSVIA